MPKSLIHTVAIIFCLASVISAQNAQTHADSHRFVENKGQVQDENSQSQPDVLYYSDAPNFGLYLRTRGVSYQLSKKDFINNKWFPNRPLDGLEDLQVDKIRLDLNFLNTPHGCHIESINAAQDHLNFYFGKRIAESVRRYEQVSYKSIYEKIDLVYSYNNGQLKYDFIVAPGADASQIKIEIEGADKIELEKNGTVSIITKLGKIIEGAPLVFQGKRIIPSRWRLHGTVLSFEIGAYDRSQTLVIDPLIRSWGTYYGGGDADNSFATCTDNSRNVYLTGWSRYDGVTLLSTAGVYQTVPVSGNAYMAKFDSTGQRLWCTYYGGKWGPTIPYSCAADTSSNVIMTGITHEKDSTFTTPGAFQPVSAGNQDAFLVKLDNNGQRIWATFYGSQSSDWGSSCATDRAGNIYLCGRNGDGINLTLATTGAFQTTYGHTFLAKFDVNGNRIWGTYYNGFGHDYNQCACATDENGNVFLCGQTPAWSPISNTSIATSNGFQTSHGGGFVDLYVAKFNSSGNRLWGTFFGGTGDEIGVDCTTDQAGNVYAVGHISGTLASQGITTPGCHQPQHGGGYHDGLIVKFSDSGVRLWSTLYGGNGVDQITGCSTDIYGNLYVSGTTQSGNGTSIATTGAHQSSYSGGPWQTSSYYFGDAFLAQFNSNGQRLVGTYYGGSSPDVGEGCATDKTGVVYLAGGTMSGANPTVIATPSGFQTQFSNGATVVNSYSLDAFLVQFENCSLAPIVNNTSANNTTMCAGRSSTLSVSSTGPVNWFANNTSTTPLLSGPVYITGPLSPGSYTWYAQSKGSCAIDTTKLAIPVTVFANPTISVQQGSVCPGYAFIIQPAGAATYTFSSPTLTVSPPVTTDYTIAGFSQAGCVDTAICRVFVFGLPTVQVTASNKVICAGTNVTLTASGAQTFWWPGAISNTIVATPTANTTYTVIGIDMNGCQSTFYYEQEVIACTGINDKKISDSGIDIFPNPSSGVFTISLNEDAEIVILNMLGSVVHRSPLKMGNNSLDVQQLSKGAYFLRCGTAVAKIIIK